MRVRRGRRRHVRCAEPGGVGAEVVVLLLGLALGGHPRAVVVDLALDVRVVPSQAAATSGPRGAARGAQTAVPGLDRDPRAARQDVLEVRAPSWVAA